MCIFADRIIQVPGFPGKLICEQSVKEIHHFWHHTIYLRKFRIQTVEIMFDDDEEEYYEGNFNEDLERFEKSLKGESVGFIDSDKLEAIIDHYLINGQYTKANLCAERGMSQFPFNKLFHLRKAQAISAAGQLKEALNLLAQIEKTELPSCEHLLTKASIFSQLRDSKRAIKYFMEALALSEPEDKDEIYLDLAMEYENLNDYQSAINVLNEAIKYNPHNEGAIYEIAFCYDQIGDYERAIRCYSDFIDENPYSFTAWYNLGNAYSKMENWNKAVWAYDYCVLINEEFSPAYFNLGNAYLSMDKFQLSIDNFEKCMQLDGEDGLALCYIGECHEQLGNYDLAKHYYHRSIEFVPELPEAWLGLGIVSDLEGNTIEGINLINKAISLDPANGSFYHVLAGAFEKIESYDKAVDAYLLSLELDPNNDEAVSDYVELLIEQQQIEEAKIFLEEFDAPEDLRLIVNLLKANLLWITNSQQEAIDLLILCITEDEEKSRELFSLYPNLKNESKIVNLFSN